MAIKYLVVHISDSPKDRGDTAKDIHLWHKQRGWDGIGYHAVITGESVIEPGRPDYWQGAHVRGFNENSLGICIITDIAPDAEQLKALHGWLTEKSEQYPGAKVLGHCDLDSGKTCPNMDIPTWWAETKGVLYGNQACGKD